MTDDRELRRLIATRIQKTDPQRVPFATFMDWALYEPRLGYYAAPRQKIGAGGDYTTSPHLGADFGELLAEQLLDLWISLERPAVFQVVEMGAGQGLIAGDVLTYLSDRASTSPTSDYAHLWQSLQYVIVEKTQAFIAEQRHALKPFVETDGKLAWRTWDEIPDRSILGCCFSNELVDAFPVHCIEIQDQQLQEIYVTVADSTVDHPQFTEVVASPSTPALQTYLAEMGIEIDRYPEGYRSEINLAAQDWLKTLAQKLDRGYVLTIDYGHTAAQYYSPQRHQGTLQCYYRQAHHNDPYWAVGHQDITAHVNFTALQHFGQSCGLVALNFTQQGLFLMALGLGDHLSANLTAPKLDLTEILHRREALHALINPMGLGGFGVLLQGAGNVPDSAHYPFKGFQMDLI
ncbi:MAG: SAM-dependent methyltransferase [Thermosynechococcaceae cyanobacterium]